MAAALLSLHNVLSSCCGESGNLIQKLFHKKDDDEDDNAAAAATPAGFVPSTKLSGSFTDKQAKYQNNVSWSKLPINARKAAKVLGYEEQQWDESFVGEGSKPPPPHIKHNVLDRHWKDLSEEQRGACETLGWEELSWDSKYETKKWEELPAHVKKAAGKVGFDKEKWDEDKMGEQGGPPHHGPPHHHHKPPHEQKPNVPAWQNHWYDFSAEEKKALNVLGYNAHSWPKRHHLLHHKGPHHGPGHPPPHEQHGPGHHGPDDHGPAHHKGPEHKGPGGEHKGPEHKGPGGEHKGPEHKGPHDKPHGKH